MVKHYYKVVDEYGEVVAVGYGYNENEITEIIYFAGKKAYFAKNKTITTQRTYSC